MIISVIAMVLLAALVIMLGVQLVVPNLKESIENRWRAYKGRKAEKAELIRKAQDEEMRRFSALHGFDQPSPRNKDVVTANEIRALAEFSAKKAREEHQARVRAYFPKIMESIKDEAGRGGNYAYVFSGDHFIWMDSDIIIVSEYLEPLGFQVERINGNAIKVSWDK